MRSSQENLGKVEDITPELKLLADAKSLHNKNANRIWLFSATLTLIVFSSRVSSENSVQFLGLRMDAELIYPIVAIILSLVNIVYISSQLQANKMSDLFHAYLRKIDAHSKEIAVGFTVADAAHALYSANINRIFPIADRMPKKFQYPIFLIFRMTADLLLAFVPAFGVICALVSTDEQKVYFLIIAVFSLISLLATAILLFTTLRYTITRAALHWRGLDVENV